jgi:bifunctional DNase/RNase
MDRLRRTRWFLLGFLASFFIYLITVIFWPIGIYNFTESLSEFVSPSIDDAALDGIYNEMIVESINVGMYDDPSLLVLKEKEGDLYLPILIGPLEAITISLTLNDVDLERPLTADLLCSLMSLTDTAINNIVIEKLEGTIFYASVYLVNNWEKKVLDARPSDAIAIALKMKVPIYVTKEILDMVGVSTKTEIYEQTI